MLVRLLQVLGFALLTGLAASCAPTGTDTAPEGRGRVESGLLLAVSFEGEDDTHSVAERMADYGVPGLSFVDPGTGLTVDFAGPDDRREVIVYGGTGVRVPQ